MPETVTPFNPIALVHVETEGRLLFARDEAARVGFSQLTRLTDKTICDIVTFVREQVNPVSPRRPVL